MEDKEVIEKEEKKDNIVVRLNTVNVHSSLEVEIYELPSTPDSEYVVDDSNFIPMSEAIKQLGSNNVGSEMIKSYYDFPDGNDTGVSIPISRTKNGKDIAELSSEIMNNVNEIAEKTENAKKTAAERASFEKKLADIKANSGTSATE